MANNNNLDLVAVLLISFGLLLLSALTGRFMAYPLLCALLLFVAALYRRGFSLSALFRMGLSGARQSIPVVQVLLLIGMVTAVWMAAGTVPALVYYGTELMSPRFFILWAFVLTAGVSVLTGTSFGTVGTIGIALMVVARSSGVPLNPIAGAIIAGAFVGDRCSPMSSSAHLVASVTRTDLYNNLRNMMKSGFWPLLLSLLFYAGLSLYFPAQTSETSITGQLPDVFDLSPFVLLPAAALLLLALLQVDVKLAMLVSIAMGIAIAHTLQNYSLPALFKFILLGYTL
ncbi:MAG: Na+/H+ antiporter NhaC family protein, partial [Cyanobacteria bacterium J06632_3]